RLSDWLEAADLIRCEWVRGHDGEVLILAYDQVVEGPLSAQTRSVPRSGAEATRSGAEATRSGAEQPGETGTTRNKEYISQEENADQSFEFNSSAGVFTPERAPGSAIIEDRRDDAPNDPLKDRCIAHFTAKGVSVDDCLRAIDDLRAANIADALIDAALGQAIEADAKSLRYIRRVARDWYAHRTGAAT